MNLMNIVTYTLKLFNTGQVTLPKAWRKKYETKNFLATETKKGLLIKPIVDDEIVYFEHKNGFGLYCEKGLPVEKIIQRIDEMNG